MRRANGRVCRVVVVLILVWDVDHRTRGNAPPRLDARLDSGSVVVDAFSADGASGERHVQVVKGRDVRGELDVESKVERSGTCLRCRGGGGGVRLIQPPIKAL